MLDYLTFDTEPIMSFFRGEPGAKQVTSLLEKVQNNDIQGYINIFNLTEIYYMIARHDTKAAEESQKLLRRYGIMVIPVEDNGLWREAALIKNKYHLSLGDSFAVATAQVLKTKLVVGSDKALNGLPVELLRIR